MDWETYKTLCARPENWSRWMLEQTRNLLESHPAVKAKLIASLAAVPLSKPHDHKGDARTDMLATDLTEAEIADILDAIRRVQENAPDRGLRGFELAWQEYLVWVRTNI